MKPGRVKLNRYGKKELTGHILGPVFIAAIFFAVAGSLSLPRAWIWAILTTLFYISGMMVVYLKDPVLLNERGSWSKKKDTKKWDKIVLQVFGTVGLYGHTVLMALDAGRFGWTSMENWTLLPGLVLYTAGFVLIYWAMAVNTHFETTVRIQHDRDHRVISGGPYQIVRHPGYCGLIIVNFGSAMIIGSMYGLITATLTLAIIGIRTWLEDRTLQAELTGYRDFCKRTKYRLLPLVW